MLNLHHTYTYIPQPKVGILYRKVWHGACIPSTSNPGLGYMSWIWAPWGEALVNTGCHSVPPGFFQVSIIPFKIQPCKCICSWHCSCCAGIFCVVEESSGALARNCNDHMSQVSVKCCSSSSLFVWYLEQRWPVPSLWEYLILPSVFHVFFLQLSLGQLSKHHGSKRKTQF